MKSLRCLLFSSNEEMVQPIWQVLADLGIEGEYCQSAVDAVEKVTTQSFQIVITDWDNQPEAAFLLKTARDLKAAQRPLTLAVVSDDAKRPEALQAGANSILLKPIRAEQVRDTMSTACELLRSKLQLPAVAHAREASAPVAMATAAAAGAVSAPSSPAPQQFRSPASQPPASSTPDAKGDREFEVSEAEASAGPTTIAAHPLPSISPVSDNSPEQPKAEQPLTGWAMLQARLTQSAPATSAPSKGELLSYGETRSYSGSSTSPAEAKVAPTKKESPRDTESAALFAYMSEKPAPPSAAAKAPLKLGKIFLVAALAIACVGLGAVPRARQSLQTLYRNGVRAGTRLLNPPPAPLPPPVVLHDSFGQSGDEYKFPVPANIPDATTDPSQIRVLPTVDPTAKPQKNPDANSGQEQTLSPENPPVGQGQTAPSQVVPEKQIEVKDNIPTPADSPRATPETRPDEPPAQTRATPNNPVVMAPTPQPAAKPPVPRSVPQPTVSASVSAGIPSSMKSQLA